MTGFQPDHLAYIGPGAGFAFLGSFLALAGSLLLSASSLLTWPVRILRRYLRRGGLRNARVRKIIFLGLDGLDPKVTERLMAEGKLPNLARLRETGAYRRLRTTCPPLSPVAWSTFATGVNPGKHNIFDFLNRAIRSYAPELAGSRVSPPRRFLDVGKWRIPLSRPQLELRRKSRAFWSILGDHAIRSTVLRVPVTFPPERFDGFQLSAMSAPDLRGTQGSFTFFSTRPLPDPAPEGRLPLKRTGQAVEGVLEGPLDTFLREHSVTSIAFRVQDAGGNLWLDIDGERHELRTGEYSPWISLRFQTAAGIAIHGIARFLLTESGSETSLYVTPVQIDPERPVLPISHPGIFSVYLSKLLGSFATAGMAEDTWALNEGVIGEGQFLDQAWRIFEERRRMFFHALERTRHGVVACVFDTSDRVQHMFHRHAETGGEFSAVIEDLYRRMDELVGQTIPYVDDHTALFVLSDHGFCSFRRAVNLNAWLAENSYLAVNPDGSIDWSRTRAFVLGLSGLYLNLKGREPRGTVGRGTEAASLRSEISAKLAELRDPRSGERVIRAVYDSRAALKGPYTEAAPDLIIGWEDGYRTSWDAALGKSANLVFEDNEKCWSGDHCVDPALVPGVLFSNRRLDAPDPGIEDMAPTALKLFGVDPPGWMEGRALGLAESG